MTDAMFSPERTICRGVSFRELLRLPQGGRGDEARTEAKRTYDILGAIRNEEEPFFIQVAEIAAAKRFKRQKPQSCLEEENRSDAHERNQPSSSNAFRVAASSRQYPSETFGPKMHTSPILPAG